MTKREAMEIMGFKDADEINQYTEVYMYTGGNNMTKEKVYRILDFDSNIFRYISTNVGHLKIAYGNEKTKYGDENIKRFKRTAVLAKEYAKKSSRKDVEQLER